MFSNLQKVAGFSILFIQTLNKKPQALYKGVCWKLAVRSLCSVQNTFLPGNDRTIQRSAERLPCRKLWLRWRFFSLSIWELWCYQNLKPSLLMRSYCWNKRVSFSSFQVVTKMEMQGKVKENNPVLTVTSYDVEKLISHQPLLMKLPFRAIAKE